MGRARKIVNAGLVQEPMNTRPRNFHHRWEEKKGEEGGGNKESPEVGNGVH